ncbi:IS6 family transposase, partial [Bacillus sp. CGMCC 1.60114]|uniref:IS6 family transposase n=1 Tax=unclassified Bacillus (in: firmicutes) TaxID=185979 RepID=UPI003637E544
CTNDSWRVDETYIKVKGQWMYLYRAVDSEGNTIDFCLSKTRDQKAAKYFFKKALRSFHVSKPRVITVDKNPAYPVAIQQLKDEQEMPKGIKTYETATSIVRGIEAMHMMKKGQVHQEVKSA